MRGALALLLPTEDLENESLRTLVADVIAEVILGNAIGGKMCEPPFIWTSLATLAEAADARIRPQASGEMVKKETRGRLEEFGLLSSKKGTDAKEVTRRSSTSSLVLASSPALLPLRRHASVHRRRLLCGTFIPLAIFQHPRNSRCILRRRITNRLARGIETSSTNPDPPIPCTFPDFKRGRIASSRAVAVWSS